MSRAVALPRIVGGAVLLLVGAVPIVQTLRVVLHADRATAAYETTRLLDSPIGFGGHVITVSDTLPQVRSGSSPEREASVGVVLDGDTVLAPRPVNVSLGAMGLSRYWLWIQAQTVRDRATNEQSLYISRRVAGSPADNPTFEVLRVSEDGATTLSTPSAGDRRDDPLLHAVLTPLAGDVPLLPYTSYGISISSDALLPAMVISVLPFAGVGLGLWFLFTAVGRSQHNALRPD